MGAEKLTKYVMARIVSKARLLSLVVVICIISGVFTACSKPEKTIVGKWVIGTIGPDSLEIILEFSEDGGFSIYHISPTSGNIEVRGRYRFLDKKQIAFEDCVRPANPVLGVGDTPISSGVARYSISRKKLSFECFRHRD